MDDQLKLLQTEKGYRYSLDPFMLAQFVELKGQERVIDLGAGNGVIALLLAHEHRELEVTGLEIQGRLAEIAQENVRQNDLTGRVNIIQGDIKEIRSLVPAESFQVAVGNPPYRKKDSGRLSPHFEKAVARHEIMISLEDFISACAYLLMNRGRANIIYHPGRLAELFTLFHRFRITPRRLRPVYSNGRSRAVMVLVEGVKNGRNPLTIEKPLIIYKEDGEYTEEVLSAFPGGTGRQRGIDYLKGAEFEQE
jgi:tRNA1Val (adenine37-N6)-methyltransferase